jgi:hypothetical protein
MLMGDWYWYWYFIFFFSLIYLLFFSFYLFFCIVFIVLFLLSEFERGLDSQLITPCRYEDLRYLIHRVMVARVLAKTGTHPIVTAITEYRLGYAAVGNVESHSIDVRVYSLQLSVNVRFLCMRNYN